MLEYIPLSRSSARLGYVIHDDFSVALLQKILAVFWVPFRDRNDVDSGRWGDEQDHDVL